MLKIFPLYDHHRFLHATPLVVLQRLQDVHRASRVLHTIAYTTFAILRANTGVVFFGPSWPWLFPWVELLLSKMTQKGSSNSNQHRPSVLELEPDLPNLASLNPPP